MMAFVQFLGGMFAGSWSFVTRHPVVCVMTAIVGIVIYKIITFYFTEEPREQREPKDTEYVLNFFNKLFYLILLYYAIAYHFSQL